MITIISHSTYSEPVKKTFNHIHTFELFDDYPDKRTISRYEVRVSPKGKVLDIWFESSSCYDYDKEKNRWETLKNNQDGHHLDKAILEKMYTQLLSELEPLELDRRNASHNLKIYYRSLPK